MNYLFLLLINIQYLYSVKSITYKELTIYIYMLHFSDLLFVYSYFMQVSIIFCIRSALHHDILPSFHPLTLVLFISHTHTLVHIIIIFILTQVQMNRHSNFIHLYYYYLIYSRVNTVFK